MRTPLAPLLNLLYLRMERDLDLRHLYSFFTLPFNVCVFYKTLTIVFVSIMG